MFDIVNIDMVRGLNKYGSTKTYRHLIIDEFTPLVWATTSKTTTGFNFFNQLQEVKRIGIDNEIEPISLTTQNFDKKKCNYLFKHPVSELINLTMEHIQSWLMEYTIHRKENVPITKNKRSNAKGISDILELQICFQT
ncbi:hypothetical protein BLOT_011663 [Blomia tropicalis]|nr:hypothetical protein BLOT_011663 [Blomia tropicalis]